MFGWFKHKPIPKDFPETLRLAMKLDPVKARISNNYSIILRCPFHKERTPSFIMHHEMGVYKCYGCGVDGSIEDLAHRRFADK